MHNIYRENNFKIVSARLLIVVPKWLHRQNFQNIQTGMVGIFDKGMEIRNAIESVLAGIIYLK